jgi:hypothetical protein
MQWIKQGLVFEPPGRLKWIATHAAVPTAYHIQGDLYRLYFTGRDELNRSRTGYIEVNINHPQNPLKWSNEPVLELGDVGTFDETGVMGSWIVSHANVLYFYYIGWNVGVSVPFRNAIGLAMSRDGGRTFTRYSRGPIMDRSIYDPCFVSNSCVLVEDHIWKMWYLSCVRWVSEGTRLKHYYHIKYAESTDGVKWERTGIVCIDFKSKEEYAISRPCVIKDGGVYKMWYSYRGSHYRIGYAESQDGIHWERKDEAAGIDVSESGWDAEMIEYPFVFDHDGQRYMLYNGNGYGKTGFGLAVLQR